MTEKMFGFGVVDWVIMSATILASAGIGLYFRFTGGKQKTNEEYLLADRNMSVFPVAVSLMASFMSAITLLGVSSENYSFGAQFVVINISYGLVTPVAAELYLPVFFGLARTSTYEYLELRFGPRIRMIASLTYTLQMVLYNGIVLYAPAIVLESATGLDRMISILVVGLVCTFYSTLGGMKAVLWTDLLQSFLMYAAVVSIVIFVSLKIGFSEIFAIAKENGRFTFNNFNTDLTERHSVWSLLFGGAMVYVSLYAVNHTQVQRLLTVSTLKKAKLCLWISWPVLSFLSITTCISGLAIYAAYETCDPYTAGYISNLDQLMPYYVIDSMSYIPGLAGLFIAGIFSASLSTVSAACNSLAAVTLSDYVGRWCTIRPSMLTVLTKLAACCYGLLFLVLAFLAEHLGGVLQAALTIFGAVGGPVFGVFTLGMFTTFANEAGASISLLSGLALTLWISFGGPRPPLRYSSFDVSGCPGNLTAPEPATYEPSDYFYLYRISYLYTSWIGFLWVMMVGSMISLVFRMRQPWQLEDGSGDPDPALFTPPLAARLRRIQNNRTPIECELLKMTSTDY